MYLQKYVIQGREALWPLFFEYGDTKNQNVVLGTRTTKHDDAHDSKL